jgi:hypothetical protein
MSQSTAAHQAVHIAVNTMPVTVSGPRLTGREIKSAAIEQGVQIDLAFQLSVRHGPRQTQIVGDDEMIAVHDWLQFIAVAGDDNS